MAHFTNQVVVITGGNSGIGFATAQTFINQGANVVIFGRNADSLESVAQELGEQAMTVQGDVTNVADLDTLFQTVKDRFGKIDILFANAGVAQFASIEETEEALYDHVFDINVKGAFYTVQKALPLMGEGSTIVFNTSVVNVKGIAGTSVYSASKAAVRSLVRTFAAELSDRAIRVNAVSPGPIETPIYDRLNMPQEAVQEFGQSLQKQVPLNRFGQSQEIANAVVFLSSPAASYIQGVELPVDGGYAQV